MENLIWLAGIMDGEGSFTVFYHKRKTKGDFRLIPRITFTNTSETLLNEVSKILDEYKVGFFIHQSNRGERNKKLCYHIDIGRLESMKKLCELLLPYLRGKKPQAELLNRFVTSRLERFKQSYTEIEWNIEREIRELNKRGVSESSETIG